MKTCENTRHVATTTHFLIQTNSRRWHQRNGNAQNWRRKFRSQISENIRTDGKNGKAELRRVREEKGRRKQIRERKYQKKMQAREKVEKSHCFGAPEQ